jgi:hypothetical protein
MILTVQYARLQLQVTGLGPFFNQSYHGVLGSAFVVRFLGRVSPLSATQP